jgi:Chorismate synthase
MDLCVYVMCKQVRNQDHRSNDYDTNAVAYRPSHADATYDAKYGIRYVTYEYTRLPCSFMLQASVAQHC